MLLRENRLTKDRDFNLLLKHGRWENGQIIDLKYLILAKNQIYFPKKEDPNSFKKQLKLAFVVGLKVSKSAVKRNRIKRQMREAARLLIKEKLLDSGYFLMLVVKKGGDTKKYAEVSEEIKLLLKRANIIK